MDRFVRSKTFDRAYYLLSNREDAEDLVQDVYVAAYSAKEQFREKSNPHTWLMEFCNTKFQTITEKYKAIRR